ncbi:MAG: endonuclease III [Candidatus Roizmanbacteria bacterium]|nr:endonuclease III [Candidatus Roizmanbacteria bacterium]
MDTNLQQIIDRLSKKYDPTIALDYTNPWELTVAVILSAQCTDKRVNIVTQTLFPFLADSKNVPTKDWNTVNKIHNITRETTQIATTAYMEIGTLEKLIYATGFYKAKAHNIQETAKLLLSKYNRTIPNTMNELVSLPGIARKTANVLLSELYDKSEGITVDTHVKRIVQRLHLVSPKKIGGTIQATFKTNGITQSDYFKNASPEKIERQLMNLVPKKYWKNFPHFIVKLGRDTCTAKKPNCSACVLYELCPSKRDI